ncbi:MAG: ABC transporter substrate-binding protein [Desulfobacula sp.]|uniref:ABC transporter substrate-binding protein n=1 Tax=Desulfobacula sp. TaxID=2593537 RepID=UPI0025C06EA6|nr:ABC transporter substrate-binding protein [Desulfobacula sp.]MCD4718813.1 ABC transporter substrate-binding protein [Desulfobacula sp.]
MKNEIVRRGFSQLFKMQFFFIILVSLAFLPNSWAGKSPTVNTPQSIKCEFPQQLELKNFEKQTGKKLSFQENPIFAKLVAQKKLSPVEQRLPEEPLVVLPYEKIGKYGGKLRGVALALESSTSEGMSWRQVSLVRISDDMSTIVPNVAKSWKWNKDYTEITFNLRKGHKWSDGEAFTADDVVFYINDIIRNKTLHKEVPNRWKIAGKAVKIKKINTQTFKFIFAKPYPGFLHMLGASGSYYSPYAVKHFLKNYHIDYNPNADKIAKEAGFDNWNSYFAVFFNKWKDAVTATKYGLKVPTLESHILKTEPDSQKRIFVANPYYFKVDTAGNQLPYITYHHERFLNKGLWPIEIMNGNIDQKSQNMGLNDFPILKENEKKGNYTINLPPGMAGPVIIFNQTHKDPELRKIYSDVRFRKAMSLAINRDEINEILFLGIATPQQALPENVPFVTAADKNYMIQFDLKKANLLLDEMGLKYGKDGVRLRYDGKPLTVLWEYTLQYAISAEFPILVADYWKKAGVKVLVKEITSQLSREKAAANTSDICMEWFVPYEVSMISNPIYFTPPYATLVPLMGAPWVDWWNTDGKSGEKPPAWAQRLRDIATEWKTVAPGSARYLELGREMVKINLENLVIIGTLGKVPLPNAVSNNLANIPNFTIDNTYYGYAYPFRADQWFFKK